MLVYQRVTVEIYAECSICAHCTFETALRVPTLKNFRSTSNNTSICQADFGSQTTSTALMDTNLGAGGRADRLIDWSGLD